MKRRLQLRALIGCACAARDVAVLRRARRGRFSVRRWKTDAVLVARVRGCSSSRFAYGGAILFLTPQVEIVLFESARGSHAPTSAAQRGFLLSRSRSVGRDFRRGAAVAIGRTERRRALCARGGGFLLFPNRYILLSTMESDALYGARGGVCSSRWLAYGRAIVFRDTVWRSVVFKWRARLPVAFPPRSGGCFFADLRGAAATSAAMRRLQLGARGGGWRSACAVAVLRRGATRSIFAR